jgi:hypothetical protein
MLRKRFKLFSRINDGDGSVKDLDVGVVMVVMAVMLGRKVVLLALWR